MPTQQWHLLAPSLVQSFQVPCGLYAPEENPSSQLIERISDILDVSLDYLAGKTDSPLETW